MEIGEKHGSLQENTIKFIQDFVKNDLGSFYKIKWKELNTKSTWVDGNALRQGKYKKMVLKYLKELEVKMGK